MTSDARTLMHFEQAHEIATRRLQGTVWEKMRAAHALYRLCLGAGQLLARVGISANSISYVSLALAAGAGIVASWGDFGWAAALVIASGMLDVLDGIVARSTGSVSRWGALLDSTVDRVADGAPLLGIVVFYAGDGLVLLVPALAMLSGFSVSYVRARAESLGVLLPPLFMRRAERVVIVTLSLLAGLVPAAGNFAAPLLLVGVATLGMLNTVATVHAMRVARVLLDRSP